MSTLPLCFDQQRIPQQDVPTIDAGTIDDQKKTVSADEMSQLIDAMQSNFNIVCDQLREAQSFYDQAHECIQLKEDEHEQYREQQQTAQYSSDEEEGLQSQYR